MATGSRSLAGRLLLSLLASAILLALAEAVARFSESRAVPLRFVQADRILKTHLEDDLLRTDADLFWRLAPSVRRPLGPGPFPGLVSNRQGVREEREIPAGKGAREVRLLFLGDSSCFGVFLENRETFVDQAERLLAARQPDLKIECINAGVPGYTIFQGLRFLATRGAEFRPDLVVLYFGWNEPASWDGLGDAEHWAAMQSALPPPLLRGSRLARWAWARFARGPPPTGAKARPRVQVDEYVALLAAVEESARDQGADLLLLVGASADSVRRQTLTEYQRETVAYARRATGARRPGCIGYVDCVAVVAALAEEAPRTPLFVDAVHPTARSDEAIGRAIADQVGPWLAGRSRSAGERK